MDRYDPALIFDLAAGLLPEDEARAAEAALTPEGRAELAAQRAVLATIGSEEPRPMTDLERARMHRAVAHGIAEATRELPTVTATTAPVSSSSRRRSVVWMRIASAAAAAALMVAVVAFGSQFLSNDGSDATADTAARTEMTQAAAGGADLTTTTAQSFASDLGSDGDAESMGGADAAEALPMEEGDLAMLETAPPLAALPTASDFGTLEQFAQELLTSDRFAQNLNSLPCYDVAVEDDDLEIAASFRVPYLGANGEDLIAIAFTDAGTATSASLIRLYDPATCEPLADTTGDE